MRPRRALSKLLVEPAAVATGDIAFNLIVFFLVCASVQPDRGKKQDLPASEQTKQGRFATAGGALDQGNSWCERVCEILYDPARIRAVPKGNAFAAKRR